MSSILRKCAKRIIWEEWSLAALISNGSTPVQFSSVLFRQGNYTNNARIHIRIVSWQGIPEETRRLMKPGLPSHRKVSKISEIRGVMH